MIVQCIIGPDPQSENIRMGPEQLMSQESSSFSFVRKADSEPNIQCLHYHTGYPQGTWISSTLQQDWLA